LKWVKTSNPIETAKQLELWLPKDKWTEINHMLVGFGQNICKPIGPMCYQCDIANVCPFKPKTKDPSETKRLSKSKSKDLTAKDESNLKIKL